MISKSAFLLGTQTRSTKYVFRGDVAETCRRIHEVQLMGTKLLEEDNQHGPMLLDRRFADREGRKCMLVKSCPSRAKIVERH